MKINWRKIRKYPELMVTGRLFLFLRYLFFKTDIKLSGTLSAEETVEHILRKRKSLIRWGDGESALFFCRDVYYQPYSRKLSKKLKKILRAYRDESDFLLAVPFNEIQMAKKAWTGDQWGKHGLWKATRFLFGKYLNTENFLGDAMLGRVLKMEKLQKLWVETDNIILVCADEQVFLKFRKDFKDKRIFFVGIPGTDAFGDYSRILKEICFLIDMNELTVRESVKILISAGPAAKVLVHELSSRGYVAYDLGIVLERYLTF